MTAKVASYSDVTSGRCLKVEDEEIPSNEDNEETDLWDRIQKLKESVCRGNLSGLRKEIEDIHQKGITVRNKIDQDRGDKQKEIKELEERVSALEKEIGILRDQVKRLQKNVDTIDAGNVMKIIENHVVTFVLPPNKKIADIDAINQMLEYVEKNKICGTWIILQNQCNIKLWTREHSKTLKKFVHNRNDYAHHKKFDLALLGEALINLMPHREQHIKDWFTLFVKVDCLLKIGILASELVDRDDISKAHIAMLDIIARECYRNVQCLQDIEIEEAKEHLVKYFGDKKIPLSDDITSVIKTTNRPRLGKLVKINELGIVSSIFQKPAIRTLDQLNYILTEGKPNSTTKEAEVWKQLTADKMWTQHHRIAMIQLKKLVSDNQYDMVDFLPIHIAKLHIPDFLGKELWDAGSDILDIFDRWQKRQK